MNVTIEPVNDLMTQAARAVHLRNEFYRLGVTQRKDFLALCRKHDDYFIDWQKIPFLERFWVGRMEFEDFNDRIEKILTQLKEDYKVQQLAQNGSY